MEFTSPFSTPICHQIPTDCDVVFVSDMFPEDYVGGAELTTQSLIDSSPFRVHKIHAKKVSEKNVEEARTKHWILGNVTQMDPRILGLISANLKYSVLEYDYKFCQLRSPEKHQAALGTKCDCHTQLLGRLIHELFQNSQNVFWMSEVQRKIYVERYPDFKNLNSIVLSSVFDKSTIEKMRHLRNESSNRSKWIVLGSQSWIKGFEASKKWCEENGLDHEVVWNKPYHEMLEILSKSKGLVYLPPGGDTCPRMVIEAKLLGCELKLNDNVQHAKEPWFDTDDLSVIEDHLLKAHDIFWDKIKKTIERKSTVSGYTTTLNCSSQKYPFIQSIKSMLGFCDEVCVVDGGSTDSTWNELESLSNLEPRLKIKKVVRDWSSPQSALFDGAQKAEARKMCTSEFCWQMDVDEIVHETDYEKIQNICQNFPNGIDLVSLPVIEYWGSYDKVRVDINPWKWRLSRNKSSITHGIPKELRRHDSEGNLFAAEGTDGCDMIDSRTLERLPHMTFYSNEVQNLRLEALRGNQLALNRYQEWLNSVVQSLPTVYHYSWFNLSRKIRLYRDFWTRHWTVLQGKTYEDTASTNMMFDVPWSQVTDEMIEERAKELSINTGGWIWHSKWNGQRIPHVVCRKSPPAIMKGF